MAYRMRQKPTMAVHSYHRSTHWSWAHVKQANYNPCICFGSISATSSTVQVVPKLTKSGCHGPAHEFAMLLCQRWEEPPARPRGPNRELTKPCGMGEPQPMGGWPPMDPTPKGGQVCSPFDEATQETTGMVPLQGLPWPREVPEVHHGHGCGPWDHELSNMWASMEVHHHG